MSARVRGWFAGEAGLAARVFWVGLTVRLLYMTLAHTYRIRPYEGHFQFAWEMGRIAKSLGEGRGFADPFANIFIEHTGPTAWTGPLYPLLIAAVFKVFGIYTATSAWVVLALNCVFSAATAGAVYEIGWRVFGRRVGIWSAWIWALYPAAMQYAVRWPWEMCLTTLLLMWCVVLTLRMQGVGSREKGVEGGSLRQWALFGICWGEIALLNASLLLFLPVCGIWVLMGTRGKMPAVRGALVAGIIFLALIAPWAYRNWSVFHAFIPLRGNLGAEMYLGSGPGSEGLLMEYDNPIQDRAQNLLYARMGEVGYVKMRGEAAKAYIKAEPGHFVGLCWKRVVMFWAGVPREGSWGSEFGRGLNFGFASLCGLMGLGLALKRRIRGAGLMAWAFLLVPLPYYFITVHARFRHPLEPLICVLGVYLFQSAERGGKKAGER